MEPGGEYRFFAVKEDVMYYKEQLESLRSELTDRLSDLEAELSGLPEGSIYTYEKNGRHYYCQRFPKAGNRKKERRVSISGDSEMVLALVRKKYVDLAVENIRNDIALLDQTIGQYIPADEDTVMEHFLQKYPELAPGLHYGQGDPAKWAEGYRPPEDFFAEDLKSISSQGEKIRSGGEMYISARLDHFGIPYRYEDDMGIPDLSYVPDFKIMRPRDRKIIYWEHFGKVNDYAYVRNSVSKVSEYIEYGIKPWDNLIMTFNNEKGGYNGKLIDAMIECWLL